MAENESPKFIFYTQTSISESLPFLIWDIHKAPAIQVPSTPQHDKFVTDIL